MNGDFQIHIDFHIVAAVSTRGAGVSEGGNQAIQKQSWHAKLQVTRQSIYVLTRIELI